VLSLLKIADLSMVMVSGVAAVLFADGMGSLSIERMLAMRFTLTEILFAATYLTLWHMVLTARGLYESYRLSAASRGLRGLFLAGVISVAPLALASVFFQFTQTAAFLLTFSALAFVGLGLERRTLRAIGRRLPRYGRNLRNVIVVGSGNSAVDLTAKLAQRD